MNQNQNQDQPQTEGRVGLSDMSYNEQDNQFMHLERAMPIKEFIDSIPKRNIEEEFKLLRTYTETKEHIKLQVSLNPYISALNRYNNIIPCIYICQAVDSHSIVKPESQLEKNKFSTPREKFYINANYIKVTFYSHFQSITNQEKAYIATQGPIPESIPDFWHMVWTNNVGLIVMLCNLTDKGRVCAHLSLDAM